MSDGGESQGGGAIAGGGGRASAGDRMQPHNPALP